MDSCDVLIVGGGPAGSTCAWALRRKGLDVIVLDREGFPRDKSCAGWITPPVLADLEIDPSEYARSRVLQPMTGFRTGSIGGRAIDTLYGRTVSYGIRRWEFDEFLLRRSGARLLLGTPLAGLDRSSHGWIVNGAIETPMVVGAGGHFCPVARHLGARPAGEASVATEEVEFEMDARKLGLCEVRGEVPEIYFCRDMLGYGWCFRKGPYLNIGLGRLDKHLIPAHLAAFVDFLKAARRIAFDLPRKPAGHAYLLHRTSRRTLVADAALLVGDAAGLAASQSGEGIRPAIESGLLAAQVIAGTKGNYRRERLEPYPALLNARCRESRVTPLAALLPQGLVTVVATRLTAAPWFARHVVLKRWFLGGGTARN
jgi:flavin-dependent dehydrogenase